MPDAFAPEFLALQQSVAGRYSLERELGRGGMGIVFLARDVALDRLVAIKLLPPQQAAQAGLKERFLREARTSAQLSHPNIVGIHLVEEKDGLVYFVMAFVEGESLGARLRARGPLSPPAGAKLLQEVAWALAYAHLRGIVHRDVKPDNILIEQGTGRAMVSDFGIARAGETTGSTSVGEIIGTAQYMSPEQACGEKVDGRSDIYSLGIVGWCALAGKLPFDGPDVPALLAMQITKPAPPLSSVAPGIPARVAQAIDRALAKSPDDRWPTGEAFAEAIAQAQAVVRETPAPIRVWLARDEGVRRMLWGWTALMGTATVIEIIQVLMGQHENLANDFVLLGLPWLIFTLKRLYQTQQVLMAGYSHEDLRIAMQQQIEQRREELAFEYDREPPLWAKIIRKGAYGGLIMAATGAAYVWAVPIPSPRIAGLLIGLGSAIAGGGAIIGRMVPGRRLKARDTILEYRLKLMDSKLGKFLAKLTTIGLKTNVLPAGAHRPTEIAIGLAAGQIFDSLTRETRKSLKDLPPLIKRLENEAQLMRARVDELTAMIAGIGETTPAVTQSLSGQAGVAVEGQREKLRADLQAQRDQAAGRLSTAVAALENVRLDLLRLKAGASTVDQLTADLRAAREVEKEIQLRVEAKQEMEAALRGPTPPSR